MIHESRREAADAERSANAGRGNPQARGTVRAPPRTFSHSAILVMLSISSHSWLSCRVHPLGPYRGPSRKAIWRYLPGLNWTACGRRRGA